MKLIFVFVFLLIDSFSLINLSTKAKNVYENNNYQTKKKNNLIKLNINYAKNIKLNQFKNYLNQEIVQLKEILASSENQAEILNPQINELDVEADSQYFIGDIFYGEGNVTLFFNNFQLSGDKVSFDRVEKNFIVEGNVEFRKGDQYFEIFYSEENRIKKRIA